MSDWISVDDRLPDLDCMVLIANKDYGGVGYDFALWNGDYWTRKAWPLGYTPTHWMPLPLPPEDK